MAGEQDAVENAGDLVVADLGALLLQANEIARQIVGRARMALRDKGAAIVPVFDHVAGVRQLLRVRQIAPRQKRATDRPGLDLRHISVRHADKPEQHESRNIVGELADELGLAVADDGIERVRHDLPDLRLDRLEAARAEAALNQFADAGVIGRHAGGETGIGGEAALLHDPLALRAHRDAAAPAHSPMKTSASPRTPL